MKSGSQQSKVVMSARPPMRTAQAMLDDLEKVSAITEAPSRAAASALVEAEEGAKPEPAVSAPVAQAQPAVAAPKAKVKGRVPMPWDDLAESKSTQQTNFKLPVALLAKLKFLGETTYGESQTSIVKKALEETVARMLKERGLS